MDDDTWEFSGELFRWDTEKAAWYFVAMPVELSEDLSDLYPDRKAGFGSLKVEVIVGSSRWQTSLFPDNSRGAYVLPVKAAVRRAEDLDGGDTVTGTVRVL